MPVLRFLKLCGWPIWRQLMLEEALLRSDERSWFIWNSGSMPAIVLGMSNSLEQLVDLDQAYAQGIPILRRFSAGGAVVVDQQTRFTSWIVQQQDLPNVKAEPHAILQWTGALLDPLGVTIHGQDYTMGGRKIAGNAQYIRRSRWLHHSCFLWDYSCQLMNLLHLPSKQPEYRRNRSHADFCTRLSSHLQHPEILLETILNGLSAYFKIEEVAECQAEPFLRLECRRATRQLLLHHDGTHISCTLDSEQSPHKVVLANSGPT